MVQREKKYYECYESCPSPSWHGGSSVGDADDAYIVD